MIRYPITCRPTPTRQHDVADLVLEEELHVVRIGVEHQDGDGDRDAAQRRGGHPPVRADRADAPAQLEALADHVRQLVQNLGQVAAGALLQQHRGYKEVHVERRDALGQALQRDLDGKSQVVLLEGAAEFARHRLGELAINHFKRHGKRMAGAHGARNELQRFREYGFEFLQAAPALMPDVQRTERARPPGRPRNPAPSGSEAAPRPNTNPAPNAMMLRCTRRAGVQRKPACSRNNWILGPS